MITAKDLTEEQRKAMEEWAREGSQLADIQQRLKGQFGLNVTYMDTRFLVLDLGLELESEASEEAEPESGSATVDSGEVEVEVIDQAAPSPLDPETPAPAGGVTVNLDELARPGALVSGQVTFSDGKKAGWLIDQMGRLGLDPDTPGYQPSNSDAVAFENQLRKLLDE